ncbi:hypothetical protein [Cyanobium gracile]|uniref:Uncharacterized protein n=1 Tax=Cyanobium gracile UHCC 0281 TaxID=3110309 RepID=A0ABU5SSX4_9CYAN|nr:hypothetical protein [Cyanobium gracile]MEA5441467.1 hypothetical protein [Cyanobium gracile UHCC 0281]
MTPAEAVAAIPLAAICCDSNVGREKAAILKEQLVHRSPSRRMTPLAFDELIEGLPGLYRRDHWQELIYQAIPALTTLGNELALPTGRAAQIQELLVLLQRQGLIGETGG